MVNSHLALRALQIGVYGMKKRRTMELSTQTQASWEGGSKVQGGQGWTALLPKQAQLWGLWLIQEDF